MFKINKPRKDYDVNPTQNNLIDKNKSGFVKFKEKFLEKPPKERLIVVSVLSISVLVLGVLLLSLYGPKDPEPVPEPQITKKELPPEPTTVPSRLTGVQIEPSLNERAVTGVMIENSIDARPQAGLEEADIVFEAIAEGGITRFLALYQESKPGKLGPIRSARPYYVRWAAGFDAAYAHVGGSGEALGLIGSLGLKDLPYDGTHFDRVSYRYAPHNVYTSMDRLDALKQSRGYHTSNFKGYAYLEPSEDADKVEIELDTEETEQVDKVSTTPKASNISFNISGPQYNTSYTYNPESKSYDRIMAGQPHTDEVSGKQISPTAVIALITTYGYHPDGVHSQYATIGSGRAIIFQNGEVFEAKWSKTADKEPLVFTNAAGEPFEFQPGQKWITAIPEGRISHSP